MVIRPLAEKELPTLIAKFTDPDFVISGQFDRRFQTQQSGQSVYLLAWVDDDLAGQLHLKWRGSSDPDIAAKLPNYAHVGALEVAPEFQRRGVTTALLRDAESRARQKGLAGIGLQVAVGNKPALGLYAKCGYSESGLALQKCGVRYHDRKGITHWHEEVCAYLIKTFD